MKRLLLVLLPISLFVFSCEDGEDIVDGFPIFSEEVTLWGVSYPVETTTSLNLSDSLLIGPIPPEIGDLVNLKIVDLKYP